MEEEWKPVPDFPNYEVSNMGKVKNKITGLLLSPYMGAVILHQGSQRFTYRLHRLVYTVFNGPIPLGYTVGRKDRDTSNNRLDNLFLAKVNSAESRSSVNLKNRKCHDCGRPTNDYRCPKCLAKWRRKNRVSLASVMGIDR